MRGRFLTLGSLLLLLATTVAGAQSISLISENLSHRIVLLDSVEVRLKLLIGFEVDGVLPSGPAGTRAEGTLSRGGSEVASFDMPRLDHAGGNLVFYMPYDVPSGDYDLRVELFDIASGETVASFDGTVEEIETICGREGATCNWRQTSAAPLDNPSAEPLGAETTTEDLERGYILWRRHPFRYVYPNSAPAQSDVVSEISLRLARNEYEPATFSIYALEDLETVGVGVGELTRSGGGTLDAPEVRVVRTVPRYKNKDADAYEMRPRLLDEPGPTAVAAERSQRFWLTFHAPQDAEPGTYTGAVDVTTPGGTRSVPLSVEVLPFALEERPDKEYGLMMTYVFQEMTAQDLTVSERQKVYENGLRTYRSFRDHGLTMVFPHSPFVFRRLPDGTPDLRDLEAAVTAHAAAGFSGPMIYYCGHLVQSSKPDWAGSTWGYDGDVHPGLLQEIVAHARQTIPGLASIDFYWMPGDEAHDDRGGPDREAITKELLDAVWAVDEQGTATIRKAVDWPLEIKLVKRDWGSSQPAHGVPWQYPNGELRPHSLDDAESVRRAYGLSHVESEYVGIAPWTFQTSENAYGDPYTDVDTRGNPEVMLAYPGTDGPMPTPEYEALREGIDDGRYGFALETRIDEALQSGDPDRQQLGQQAQAAYQELLDDAGGAGLEEMDAHRDAIVGWIEQLEGGESEPDPPTGLIVF